MPSDRAKRAGSGSRWTRQIVCMILQATHHLGAQISTAPGPWQGRTRVIFESVSLPRSAATLRNPGAPLGGKLRIPTKNMAPSCKSRSDGQRGMPQERDSKVPSEPQRWNQSWPPEQGFPPPPRIVPSLRQRRKNPTLAPNGSWTRETASIPACSHATPSSLPLLLTAPPKDSRLLRHRTGHAQKNNVDALTGQAS